MTTRQDISTRIDDIKEKAIEKTREEVLRNDVIKDMTKTIEEESYKIIEQKHILNFLKKEHCEDEHEKEIIQIMIELELKKKEEYERYLKKNIDCLIKICNTGLK